MERERLGPYLHAQVAFLTERALAVPDLLTGIERAKTLLRLAAALDPMGRRARQEECAREAELLSEKAGDDEVRRHAATALGTLFWRVARYEEAEASQRRALDFLVEHAPAEHHESMLTNVRLHREIMDACREHLTGDGGEDDDPPATESVTRVG